MPAMTTACALAAATCWVCRPLVTPRWRDQQRDAETQRYTRVLGRQGRLTILAVILTVIALAALITAPGEENRDLHDLRRAAASCGEQESPYDPPTCYALQPGGQWVVEELRADGTRQVVTTVTHPSFRPSSEKNVVTGGPHR